MQKEIYEYIRKTTNDPIIEWRVCPLSGEDFPIFQSDKKFYEKISPVYNWVKKIIPFPTLAPTERERRKLTRRNIRKLYKRTCSSTWLPIISMYAPESPYKHIWSNKAWWSDNRNPCEYGKEFNKDISALKQFYELLREIPQLWIINDDGVHSENCAYCCDFSYSKDSYLVTWSWRTELCMYADNVNDAKWVIDSHSTNNSENAYECIACDKVFTCFYLTNSFNCAQCWYGFDLQWCTNCIWCVGLRNKQYQILNKQFTKEEFEKQLKKIQEQWRVWLKNAYQKLLEQSVHKSMYNLDTQDCIWDNLVKGKNMIFCNDVWRGKDCKRFFAWDTPIYCQDIIQSGQCELCYESITPDDSFWCAFTLRCWKCTRVFYSDNCHGCTDCFLCSWLKNMSYCILNKQYTKAEYEDLVPQIIDHMEEAWEWWEFFHPEYSPFAYNWSVAQEYYPMTKEWALKSGYSWRDKEYPINIPEGIESIGANIIPSGINQVSDDILKKAIICEISGKPFRILKEELSFYRKHGLAIPKKHPEIRHQERLAQRPGRKMYVRTCDRNWERMLSTFPQNASFPVYSEKEYLKEIQ